MGWDESIKAYAGAGKMTWILIFVLASNAQWTCCFPTLGIALRSAGSEEERRRGGGLLPSTLTTAATAATTWSRVALAKSAKKG